MTPANPAAGTPDTLAVVVGGSRGIGLAIAESLGRAGHRVLLTGRSSEALAAAADELGSSAIETRWLRADASSPEGATAACDLALEWRGGDRIVLVYAAGVFGPIGPVAQSSADDWRAVIETNLLGAFYATRLLLPPMLDKGWGRIVYVSSKAAINAPGGGAAAYAISKIGLNRLAFEVAAEVAGSGVTANAIHPGEVRTAMWADIGSRAPGAGKVAEGLTAWAQMVDSTGGDPVTLGAEMVAWLVEHPNVSGELLLPEDFRRLRDDDNSGRGGTP